MATYFTKITTIGTQKLARAIANKVPLDISEMAVGDGNGRAIDPPKGTELKLVNECFRAPMSALYRNKTDESLALAEVVIPSDKGGFSVRELGVFDSDGDMIAYGNFPDTYKPVAAEGATRDMTIRAGMKVGNASAVNLVIDTNIVGATREWVASIFAPLDSPEFVGTPVTTTPAADDVSTRIPSTEWVVMRLEEVAGNYAKDVGAANAYVVALNPPVTAYKHGLPVKFRATHANTLASTLNAGAGPVPLVRDDGSALQAGDVALNALIVATYDQPTGSFLVDSIVPSQLGALARLGIGAGMQNVGGNLAMKLAAPSPLSIDSSGALAFGVGSGLQLTDANLGMQLADSSLRIGATGVQSNAPIVALSGTAAITKSANAKNFVGTGALTLDPSQNLWNGFRFSAAANGGTITLTPDAADRFVGGTVGSAYTLLSGTSAEFVCDGAGNWAVLFQSTDGGGAKYINAAATLTKGEYLVDTANGRFTCLLPANPSLGQSLTFVDVSGSWVKNPWVLGNNGSTIMGYNASLTINVADQKFTIWFNGTTWRLV